MSRHRRPGTRRRRLGVEALEDRRVPTTIGAPWSNAEHLTLSFVPDGTPIAGHLSDLFRTLDAQLPTSAWQGAILRAFQTWAIFANVNIGLVPDGGEPLGTPGPDQGDNRFGDIRVGAQAMAPQAISISVPHDPFFSGTMSGDMLLNSLYRYGANGVDLFTVALHEAGHVLGLDDNSDPSSAMFRQLVGRRVAPSPGDVHDLRALYGSRAPDPFEGSSGNDSLATAARLPIPGGYDGTTPLVAFGDISSLKDVDFFSFRPLSNEHGPATIRLQTSGVSLLAPHLTIYDSHGHLLGDVSSTRDTGDTLSFILPKVDPSATYYIRVAAGRSDVFGIGAYGLAVSFDDTSVVSSEALDSVLRQSYLDLSPDDINQLFLNPQRELFADDHRSNDSLANPTTLQSEPGYPRNAHFAITASLSSPLDVDTYRLDSPDSTTKGSGGGTDSGVQTGPLEMTVTLRASQVNGVVPRVVVRDKNFQPVFSRLLADGNGSYVVQVPYAMPNSRYFLQVSANPGSGQVAGNYALAVDFGHVVAPLKTFAAQMIGGANPVTSFRLYIAQSQLFQFLITAAATGAPAGTAVRMTIFDMSGNDRFDITTRVGDAASGSPVFLSPGAYNVRFSVLNPSRAPLPAIGFLVSGSNLSDPIGPAINDPTLTPIYQTPQNTHVYVYPASLVSLNPYYWLAIGR